AGGVVGGGGRVLRAPGAAEEVLQEVFGRVWREASQYDAGRGSPEAWLLMRARSRAIDRLRSIRKRDRTFVTTADESLARAAEKEGDPAGSAAGDRGLVERGLNRLPAAQPQGVGEGFLERSA